MPKLTHKTSIYSLIALCVFLSINNVIFNILPIVLGTASISLNLSDDNIGFIGSIFLLGTTLANLSSIYWVNRCNWQKFLLANSILTCALLFLASLSSYQELVILFFIIGLCSGSALACVFCAIAAQPKPEKIYGIGLGMQVSMAGLVIFILQFEFISILGFEGLMLSLAGIFLVASTIAFAFPSLGSGQNNPKANKNKGRSTWALAMLIPLTGIAIYFLGQTAIWAFLQRIGDAKSLDHNYISYTIALVLILCSLGAFAASWLGTRLGRNIPLLIASALFIGSIAGLYLFDSAAAYFIAVLVYSCAWNFALPYQLLAVNAADPSGKMASLIPTFQNIGGTLGPGIGGVLITQSGNQSTLYIMTVATTVLCLFFFIRSSVVKVTKPLMV
ncbi:MFS transporter [Dasania marina]|uniref:MFS transporter n=1 Tax=Dasania marina TaxID=471499 RepID=UPI0003816916|nr:MFS transporter [Dasania marina]